MVPRLAPAWAACRTSAPYPSPPWFEIRKNCTRSLHLSEKCALAPVVCTQTVPPSQRSDTVCNNAVRLRTSDTSRWGQTPPQARRRSSRNALSLPSPPSEASVALGGRSLLAGRPGVVCDPVCLFFRAFLVFRHHDSRGDRTCDPQTPPSVSLNGLQLLLVTQQL